MLLLSPLSNCMPCNHANGRADGLMWYCFVQESEERKRRLRAELLRWHPDKFTGHFAQYLAETDKMRILARVQEISQMLTAAAKANDNAVH